MSTPPLNPPDGPPEAPRWFDLGPGRALVGTDGCAAEHPCRPGHRYRAGGGTPRIRVAGTDRSVSLVRQGADLDEVELVWGVAGCPGLRLVVRHGFGATWTQRYTLDNAGPEAVTVDRLAVGATPGSEAGSDAGSDAEAGWALAAGAEAFWLGQPADGAGPVLAGVLQLGEVSGYDTDGWIAGPVLLEPGRRFVLQWQLDWSASSGVFERRRSSVLPVRTVLPEFEPCEIDGTDAAVVAGPNVQVGTEGATTVLVAERAGTYPVELRSARGTVRFPVSWFRTLPDRAAAAEEHWLAGPRTPSGVVRLPGPAAGLVLQADHRRLSDPDGPAAEALQRLTARLLDREGSPEAPTEGFALALLAGEALRTGDPDCAAAARVGVLAAERPFPGLGLATTRVGLAELAAGRPIGDLVDHVGRLAPAGPESGAAGQDVTELAARLELALISRRQASGVADDLLALVRALGIAVGGGLPGAPARPWPADRLAHVAAVLAMVPEAGAGGLTRWCLLGPQALADQVRRRALAALDVHDHADDRWPGTGPVRAGSPSPEPDDGVFIRTLAWLVLGQPPA